MFIDYFFFVDQWDCTKFLSICDRFATSEERFRTLFHGNSCNTAAVVSSSPCDLVKVSVLNQALTTSHTFYVSRYNERCSLLL